jgi:hypothetical protein
MVLEDVNEETEEQDSKTTQMIFGCELLSSFTDAEAVA